MLHKMPKFWRGVLLVAILGPAAFSLLFIGDAGNVLRGVEAKGAIVVGDTGISADEVSQELTRAARALASQSGGALTETAAREFITEEQIVGTLVQRALIQEEANSLGLTVTKNMIGEALREQPAFRNSLTGEYDPNVARQVLQQNGFTEAAFTALIQGDMLRLQLADAIAAGPATATPVLESLIERQTQRRAVDYLVINPAEAGEIPDPTTEDLQSFVAANAVDFSTPEYRTAAYVSFMPADFVGGVEAPEEELRQLYEFNKSFYEIEEKRTLRLLTVDTEEDAKAALGLLEEGSSFNAVAEAFDAPLDETSLLDVTADEVFDPSAREAAFSLAVDETSGPIEGAFAWFVVRVVNITPGSVTPFEEVRDDLAAEYAAEDAQNAMFEALERFEAERDGGTDLRAAAAAADVTVLEIPAVDEQGFDADGGEIPALPLEALREIFDLPVGDESQTLDRLGGDGYFAVAVDDARPSAVKPLDDIRDEAAEAWRARVLSDRLSEIADALAAAARTAGGLASAAEDRTPLSKTLQRTEFDEAFSPSLMNQIFFSGPGEVLYAPARLGDSYVVAEVKGVLPPTIQADAATFERLTEERERAMGDTLFGVYIDALQDDYKVRTNETDLAQIFPREF